MVFCNLPEQAVEMPTREALINSDDPALLTYRFACSEQVRLFILPDKAIPFPAGYRVSNCCSNEKWVWGIGLVL